MANDLDNSPKLIIKELENSQKTLNDTIQRFEQFGSLENKLSKANNSLEDNSKDLGKLSSELQDISKTLLLLLDSFKEIVTNFSNLDIAHLSKLITDSNDSYESKIKNIENKIIVLDTLEKKFDNLKIDNDSNKKELVKMAKTSIANSQKHEDSLQRISESIVIIQEQTKKKGIFS